MAKINLNYEKLEPNYLFTEIANRTAAFIKANPDAPVIKLGIGDVTRPLAPIVVDAMVKAIEEGLEERKMDKEADREREVAAEDESGERTEGEKEFVMVEDGEEDGLDKTKAPAKKAATRQRKATTKRKTD